MLVVRQVGVMNLLEVMVVMTRENWSGLVKLHGSINGMSLVGLISLSSGLKLTPPSCVDGLVVTLRC